MDPAIQELNSVTLFEIYPRAVEDEFFGIRDVYLEYFRKDASGKVLGSNVDLLTWSAGCCTAWR